MGSGTMQEQAADKVTDQLVAFVTESNRIEGITRLPSGGDLIAHLRFLDCTQIGLSDVIGFVTLVQPGAQLRVRTGLNVRVGAHRPPPGSPRIREDLEEVLKEANAGLDPYAVHRAYETLHPFTDGNGRSGRAIWLWQMSNQDHGDAWALRRGFLHSWYYQSLSGSR